MGRIRDALGRSNIIQQIAFTIIAIAVVILVLQHYQETDLTNETLQAVDRNLQFINYTIAQNDEALEAINQSIAGSTATVENQKVIIEYLKAVVLQNNQSLANQETLKDLTTFLRTNFNESFIAEIREDNEKTGAILENVSQLVELENMEHQFFNSSNFTK